MGRTKAARVEQDSSPQHLLPTSRLGSTSSVDPRDHLWPPEVDGAAAAQRRGVLDEDDLLVVSAGYGGPLGLDQAAGDLLAASRLMRRAGAVLPAGGGAGTCGNGITQCGEFAAGLRQEIGGFIVLDVAEEP